MARLQAIDPKNATGKAKELLDGVQQKLKMTPNLMRTLANSPAALEAYLSFSGALSHGLLNPKLREQLALVVGEQNSCGYCVAAHSALGKMAGLTADQLVASRKGASDDTKTAAALSFARTLVEKRGHASDAELAQLKQVGFNEGEIAEIVSHVALNIFTNYFNHVAATEIDFPAAPAL